MFHVKHSPAYGEVNTYDCWVTYRLIKVKPAKAYSYLEKSGLAPALQMFHVKHLLSDRQKGGLWAGR